MKKYLTAAALVALAAALSQPAAAVTFPSLTTIYVGAGVTDTVGFAPGNFATAVACTNVSGQTASVRFLVINQFAGLEADTTVSVAHGHHIMAATRDIAGFIETQLATGALLHGTVNIEFDAVGRVLHRDDGRCSGGRAKRDCVPPRPRQPAPRHGGVADAPRRERRGFCFRTLREQGEHTAVWSNSDRRGEVMKKSVFAVALAASALAFAPTASATTFPTLTTIYVGSGVRDSGGADNVGIATVFHCSNVSGVTTTIRFLVLNHVGGIAGSLSVSVAHGRTQTAPTHNTAAYSEDGSLATGLVGEGVINIESTQSGVFCNAKTIDASAGFPDGVTLPLVRVNPHPGTVE